jgi:drug/metabolite transporter (DMT)-like permease
MQEPKEDRTRGILWMLATMFCFISLDAIMKHLLEHLSLVQVTWARFFFATIVAMIACGPRLPQLVVSRHPRQQFLRSLLLMSTTGLFNAGIRTTPLATATTIMFLNPILVTVLSITALGEKVSASRWLGVFFGFLGALIVVRPWQEGFGVYGYGMLFLLAAALLNASYQILTRQVRDDDPLTSLASVGGQRIGRRARSPFPDPRFPVGAGLGGGAVQLFLAVVGSPVWVPDMGRLA